MTAPAPGEASILARLLPQLPTAEHVEIGPGDDAAVVRLPSDRLVVTTDALVEGYDFLAGATVPRWIGRKAAVQNLADVAAMGARPLALVVALSAPAGTPSAVFEEIGAGLAARAAEDGAMIVGGDLGRADRLTLAVTAMGALEPGAAPVLRSGARPGDVLAIGAPRLGRSAAGLALVLSDRARVDAGGAVSLSGVRTPGAEELVRHHDAPAVDLSLGWGAGRAARAMMDLSDGLVRDGGRLAAASGVRIDLDPAALAPDVAALAPLAAEIGEDPWQWVLHGAEEHAMLAAFAPGEVPAGFRAIGRVLEAGADGPGADGAGAARAGADGPGADAPALTLDGAPIPGEGFDHFA
jgi:thiamine-monophosphate kinase